MDTPYRPVIATQSDLLDVWRHLMTPLGFSGHSLWLLLIGPDDRPFPHLSEIRGCGPADELGAEELAGLAHLLERVLAEHAPGGRWAFLRTRPGAARPTADDHAWAAHLYALCRDHAIPHDVVHLATDTDVVALPLDEVGRYVRAS